FQYAIGLYADEQLRQRQKNLETILPHLYEEICRIQEYEVSGVSVLDQYPQIHQELQNLIEMMEQLIFLMSSQCRRKLERIHQGLMNLRCCLLHLRWKYGWCNASQIIHSFRFQLIPLNKYYVKTKAGFTLTPA